MTKMRDYCLNLMDIYPGLVEVDGNSTDPAVNWPTRSLGISLKMTIDLPLVR